ALFGRFCSCLAQLRLSIAGALQSRAGSFFPFGFRDGYANQRSGHQGPGQSRPLSEGRQLEESRRSAHLCLCPALFFFAEYSRTKIQHLPALVDRADIGISPDGKCPARSRAISARSTKAGRSEEHTSELQSPYDLVCRLLLE